MFSVHVRTESDGVKIIIWGAMAHPPGVTEQEIEAVPMSEGDTKIGTDNAEFALSPIKSKFRRTRSIPAFAIKLAGYLNDLPGAVGKQGMRLEDGEAISPDPHLIGAGVRMPVVNDCATMLIGENLEIAGARRAETGLNDITKPRAGLSDKLRPDPGPGEIIIIPEEMAKFYRAIGKIKGRHDFEPAVPACARRGLDDAARSGHIVLLTRDPLPAHPGHAQGHCQPLAQPCRQVIVAVVAVEMAQFDSTGLPQRYDNFKVATLPRTGRGLNNAARPSHIILLARDPLPTDPRQTRITIVTIEMAQFDGAIGSPQRYDNFKVATLPRTGRGLNNAARPSHIILLARDPLPTDPRQTRITIIAGPMPQFFAFCDDCLKVAVAEAPEVGLGETGINSGHLNLFSLIFAC
jgi:hypothetical protein